MTEGWSAERAEEYLLGLELFGMRFGLDRMRRLMTALGSPQRAFRSVHVVGTNGKSSTVRMIAAILERHGVATGAYLSPHLGSFPERIRIGERDLEAAAFGAAVERAARAATLVDRTLEEDDRVTQFEALTAAAYSELAAHEVDVAVVEAGLGGRYDATSVLDSEVQVLTTVGLEHTRWLGPTVADIAREKLAVVREGATLVVGAGLHPDAAAEARSVATARGARLVEAPAEPPEGLTLAAAGAFQRRNFALAVAAAAALMGELDAGAVAAAAAGVSIPGRFETIDHDPLTILDGAHNAGGMEALVGALDELAGRRIVAVLSILDDKDAAAMLASLLPACSAVIYTSNANPRALSPATLQSLAWQLGEAPPSELEADPRRALERARGLAGPAGVVLVTGSIYLVADLLRSPSARRASIL